MAELKVRNKIELKKIRRKEDEVDSAHGLIANELDCKISVSRFDLQSRYYVHFRTNILGKDTNPLTSNLFLKQYHYCSSTVMALT